MAHLNNGARADPRPVVLRRNASKQAARNMLIGEQWKGPPRTRAAVETAGAAPVGVRHCVSIAQTSAAPKRLPA